jgi:hypothetical protein
MMFSSNNCRFALFFFLSLSANAETLRGVHRDLTETLNLGEAGAYAILTKAGISTVPQSVITGNIAVSPIAATAMTGFSLTAHSTNKFSTSAQITGQAFAADYAVPTPVSLTTAVSNMEAAYTDAAGRANADAARINLEGGKLGTELNVEQLIVGGPEDPLTPGVYTFATGVTIGGDITFEGSETDIFIIQMTGNLVQVGSTKVLLEGGVLAKNIFWQVAGFVEVQGGAHMEGILLSKTSVTFETGSSLNGRILAQTECILQVATITQP